MSIMDKIETEIVETKENEKVYVKIKYNRLDDNYEGWNIWVWEDENEGERVDFIGEDEEGKFAVIETSSDIENLGFIIRRSEEDNDWAEKHFDEDRFVSISESDKMVVVEEYKQSFKECELNRSYDNVQLNLHYYRFDEEYDNWDVWAWPTVSRGSAYNFERNSRYGKLATVKYEKKDITEPIDSMNIIIRKPDWSEKDIDIDRSIDLAYANKNGVVDVYLVQGEEEVYYSESQATQRITTLNSTDSIDIDKEDSLEVEATI